jgi:hypothetical protein
LTSLTIGYWLQYGLLDRIYVNESNYRQSLYSL